MQKVDYQKVCQDILETLPARQRSVIERRFGLQKSQKRETLQKIGEDFGITRERVRQVENEAFVKLCERESGAGLKQAVAYLNKYLQKHGGFKREDILFVDLSLGIERQKNHIFFLLTLAKPFYRFQDKDCYPYWASEEKAPEKVTGIISRLLQKFNKKKKPVSSKTMFASLEEANHLLLSVVEIARLIEQGPLGDFGLTEWPEIKPRGVRDAAFVVLKQQKKPLHFRQIAEFSNGLNGEFFQTRKVLPQTVHNELIRDVRFVLVGRGLYGLKDWGYTPGTVKDVLITTLKKTGKPMSKSAILKAVQKQRLVKANTILLNLSDKSCFDKDEQGRYIIKSS